MIHTPFFQRTRIIKLLTLLSITTIIEFQEFEGMKSVFAVQTMTIFIYSYEGKTFVRFLHSYDFIRMSI